MKVKLKIKKFLFIKATVDYYFEGTIEELEKAVEHIKWRIH